MSEPIRIQPNSTVQPTARPAAQPQPQTSVVSFNDFLTQAQSAQKVRFSNHAQKRLDSRNISLSDEGLNRLANAVSKVEKRGGRESLVLMDDMAFVVNVKDRLVVTAMDAQSRGDGVFTQIDSVVFADPAKPDLSKKA